MMIEEKKFGCITRSYFISEYIEGDDLKAHVLNHPNSPLKDQALSLIQKLHQLSITHGDTKATNFIIHDEKVFLIDFDGMKLHQNSKNLQKFIEADLARFARTWT